LRTEGARISASDPQAMERTRSIFPDLQYSPDPYEVAKASEALLILTEWPEYRALDWERIRNSMLRPLLLDGRNLLDPSKMEALGFEYHSFGRPETAVASH
jgi:UDPglucose 6-dehydrogenase